MEKYGYINNNKNGINKQGKSNGKALNKNYIIKNTDIINFPPKKKQLTIKLKNNLLDLRSKKKKKSAKKNL